MKMMVTVMANNNFEFNALLHTLEESHALIEECKNDEISLDDWHDVKVRVDFIIAEYNKKVQEKIASGDVSFAGIPFRKKASE